MSDSLYESQGAEILIAPSINAAEGCKRWLKLNLK